MPGASRPKAALDSVIRKSRVHFYKPIQVAEILYRHRTVGGFELRDPESYRNPSKRWRDEVSRRLVGRASTSSQKFQDNLFERNAMPPEILAELGELNRRAGGLVEAYVYRSLQARLLSVSEARGYIAGTPPERFALRELVARFRRVPGLKRSIDKMYEIAVHALFAALVRALRVEVSLTVGNKDERILRDFEGFVSAVLGLSQARPAVARAARLFRAGVANAADRGVDMWSNFGPAVQVKFLALTPALAEDIAENAGSGSVVIVCKSAERSVIEAVLGQVGLGGTIQGVVTLDDLDRWYALAMGEAYREALGRPLLKDLEREFDGEFPGNRGVEPFLAERGYDSIAVPEDWQPA